MAKKLGFIAFVFYIGFMGDLIDAGTYHTLVISLNDRYMLFSGLGLVVSCSLVAFSLAFGTMAWFTLVYALAMLAYEASQFLICLISLLAVLFYLHFHLNLWADLHPILTGLPFLLLAVSCASIRIFDFNYPVRNTVTTHLTLTALSWGIILAVELSRF